MILNENTFETIWVICIFFKYAWGKTRKNNDLISKKASIKYVEQNNDSSFMREKIK